MSFLMPPSTPHLVTPVATAEQPPPAGSRWQIGAKANPEAPPARVAPAAVVLPRPASRWRAWMLGVVCGALAAAALVSSAYDPRSPGVRVDDAMASVTASWAQVQARFAAWGASVGDSVQGTQTAAAQASRDAVTDLGTALDDTGISAQVKTALTADPLLQATRIDVTTEQGVVRLQGPAPDAVSKERASVLAAAPRGVRGVDNRLVLPQPQRLTTVPAP